MLASQIVRFERVDDLAHERLDDLVSVVRALEGGREAEPRWCGEQLCDLSEALPAEVVDLVEDD